METPHLPHFDDAFDLFTLQNDFTAGDLESDTDSGNAPRSEADANTDDADDADGAEESAATTTYEFRWDVEVPAGERRFGQKFMKQWKRVLQVQKMSPLVSAKVAPRRARFQLCVDAHEEAQAIAAHEAEVADELAHLRFQSGAMGSIAGEPAGAHPAGWHGVRVWVQFNRQDVEEVLGKKAKI